jgi:hypothetical protein
MLSVPCITKAQKTHCASPQSNVDNSIELSYLQRLEFWGYVRPQLERRYRQNTHHCLVNVTKKREPALLGQLSSKCYVRVRCCFQCRTATYVPRDTGGRCDTFIFINLYKIFNNMFCMRYCHSRFRLFEMEPRTRYTYSKPLQPE